MIIGRQNRKPVPVPLCPPQIPHGLPPDLKMCDFFEQRERTKETNEERNKATNKRKREEYRKG
jgi:hypothetical protein